MYSRAGVPGIDGGKKSSNPAYSSLLLEENPIKSQGANDGINKNQSFERSVCAKGSEQV